MQKKSKPAVKAAPTTSEPKFPYTTKPSSLRRLLQDIPKKPKPPRFDKPLLKSWGYSDANDYSMLRVLKAVGLINANNEPTELYAKFMNIQGGAQVLGEPIKRVYQQIFLGSHKPFAEPADVLQNLFNIHSGGGDRALEQQIQTFKALCESASFDGVGGSPAALTGRAADPSGSTQQGTAGGHSSGAAININVHIHLPENKSRRDYECMIEDIGRHIFGRTITGENRNDT